MADAGAKATYPEEIQNATDSSRRKDAVLCDRCSYPMFRMRAVYWCDRCGYKTDCCGH